jgi:Mn-dependent DtxR family transcriptional regulator
MLSTRTILDAIFDKKGSDIFKSVASSQRNTEFLITKLKLTRKQYYSRMSRLTNAGLVKRHNGRYLLTEFGKVIYFAYADLEAMIEKTLDNYWKLKAIDALEISSKEKRNDIVCALVDNPEIRSILMLEEPPSSLTKSKPHDTKLKSLVFPSI